MTNDLQSFMFETGSLQTIHTVNVPFQSSANGFQSEVRFAHAVDILFVYMLGVSIYWTVEDF